MINLVQGKSYTLLAAMAHRSGYPNPSGSTASLRDPNNKEIPMTALPFPDWTKYLQDQKFIEVHFNFSAGMNGIHYIVIKNATQGSDNTLFLARMRTKQN